MNIPWIYTAEQTNMALEIVSYQLSRMGCTRERVAAAAVCLTSVFPEQKVFLKRQEKTPVSHEVQNAEKAIYRQNNEKLRKKENPKTFLKFQKGLFSLKIKTVSYNASEYDYKTALGI